MSSRRAQAMGGILIVVTLICGTADSVSGQEIDIVVPAGLEDTEGDSPFREGTFGFHVQELFHADEFAGLPTTHNNIIASAWRVHIGTHDPVSGTWQDLRITLSTTTATTLSMDFEANHGPDKTVVFDSIWNFEGESGEFETPIPFDEPFFYDPSLGRSLLFDIYTLSGSTSDHWLDVQSSDAVTHVGNNDPSARIASYSWRVQLVSQYTFVPSTLPGDFDEDGLLTDADIDMLTAAVLAGTHLPEYDLNHDTLVTAQDGGVWVKDLKYTYFGDANLDLQFNSADMVQVFTAGKYESGEDASWAEGDWNADGVFSSSDMVAAFVAGGYEKGPRTDAAAVPEPSTLALTICAVLLISAVQQKGELTAVSFLTAETPRRRGSRRGEGRKAKTVDQKWY